MSASEDTGQARPHHLVTSQWDAAGGEVLYRSCTCGEEWARDEDRCPEDDIETLDVADLLDRLDLIQARNPDEQRHLDDTLDALRRQLPAPAGDTLQAPAMYRPCPCSHQPNRAACVASGCTCHDTARQDTP